MALLTDGINVSPLLLTFNRSTFPIGGEVIFVEQSWLLKKRLQWKKAYTPSTDV